jgi:endogenous inhibitor of DNA gyrase (YacG/DUF329 family)
VERTSCLYQGRGVNCPRCGSATVVREIDASSAEVICIIRATVCQNEDCGWYTDTEQRRNRQISLFEWAERMTAFPSSPEQLFCDNHGSSTVYCT